MPKVSVIIPVYNVEQYIERCARSLFEQTLDDIEFIFVNDCTPDGSMSVLTNVINDYPTRVEQLKIINHDVNKGLPTACRSGLAIATGDYVIHCDSDDWVDKTMYQKLLEKAENEHCDMVVCGYSITDGYHFLSTMLNEFKGFKSIKHAIIADQIPNYTWNKLIRRDLFNYIEEWPKYNLLEDVAIITPIAYHCKSIEKIDEPLYFYYKNEASICHDTKGKNKAKQIITNTDLAIKHIRDHGGDKEYQREMRHKKCLVKILNYDLLWRDYITAYPEVNLSLLFEPYLPISKKLGHITKCLGIHGIPKIFK